jgi:hypothetical protein
MGVDAGKAARIDRPIYVDLAVRVLRRMYRKRQRPYAGLGDTTG